MSQDDLAEVADEPHDAPTGDVERLRSVLPYELLDGYQIAELVGVNYREVSQWMNDGELPFARIGRTRKVRSIDLVAFIDARVQREPAAVVDG